MRSRMPAHPLPIPPLALTPHACRAQLFLDKTRQKAPLLKKIKLSHDTYLFRFGLPTPSHVLGLPVGKHFKVPQSARRAAAGPCAQVRGATSAGRATDRHVCAAAARQLTLGVAVVRRFSARCRSQRRATSGTVAKTLSRCVMANGYLDA